MGGHATHDEREARATFDAQLFEQWGKRDPIGLFETYLLEGSIDLQSGKRGRCTAASRGTCSPGTYPLSPGMVRLLSPGRWLRPLA